MKTTLQQAARFSVVGILATIIHFLIAVMFVNLGMHPLIANTLAFIGAFQVSFWGHFSWSFQTEDKEMKSSILKFGMVSIGSYLVNELMLAALLQWTALSLETSLCIVLVTVAGGTFLISKFWAFAGNRGASSLS